MFVAAHTFAKPAHLWSDNFLSYRIYEVVLAFIRLKCVPHINAVLKPDPEFGCSIKKLGQSKGSVWSNRPFS